MRGWGCGVGGAGLGVQGWGCRVGGAGLGVQGWGCRVGGAGLEVQGWGCRVGGAGSNRTRLNFHPFYNLCEAAFGTILNTARTILSLSSDIMEGLFPQDC